MGKKKKHHYLSRFYLKGFINPKNTPYFWMYEKGSDEIKKISYIDASLIKNYYTFVDTKGQKDSETIENIRSKIENKSATILTKISNEEKLNQEDKTCFSVLLSMFFCQIPNFRKNIEFVWSESIKHMNKLVASNKILFSQKIEKYKQESGRDLGMPEEELRKSFLNLEEEHKIFVPPEVSLEQSYNMIKDFAKLFVCMNWVFIKATDDYKFLTSDNPIFYHDPTNNSESFYGVGLVAENIEITCPLTKEITVFLSWKGKDNVYCNGKNKQIKKINHYTVCSAEKYVYYYKESKEINKLVQKYRDSSRKMIVGDKIREK